MLILINMNMESLFIVMKTLDIFGELLLHNLLLNFVYLSIYLKKKKKFIKILLTSYLILLFIILRRRRIRESV